jgi:hypothetical protein
MFDNLTDQNFALYAAKNYDNPSCVDVLEYQEDLNRIKYLKRLFRRYEETGELKERLIINHLVVIYNVFEHQAATRMLALKLCDYLHVLKPFLVMLGYWPITIDSVNGSDIDCRGVPVDENIVDKLRRI